MLIRDVAARILVAAQLLAVRAALAPFTTPLTVFATAVSNAQATAAVTVTGLNAALTGLATILTTYVGNSA